MDITVELRQELKSLIKWWIEDIKRFDDILNEIEEVSQNKWKWEIINKVEKFINDVDILAE